MTLDQIHDCPRCQRALPPEHVSRERGEFSRTTYLYCEDCGRVWERQQGEDGEVFTLDYREATEPRNFCKALARMVEARVA